MAFAVAVHVTTGQETRVSSPPERMTHSGNNGGNNGAVAGWRWPTRDSRKCLKRQRPALVVAGRWRLRSRRSWVRIPPGAYRVTRSPAMHLSMAGLRAFRRCVHKDRAANVWARAPGTPTDDPRAIPPRRPPHDRLDRALPRNDRAAPRPLPRRPGRDPPAPAAPRARARRAVRRDPPGPGRRDPAGHHALAVPQLLRVLPGERVAPRDPRRSRLLGARRAGNAVGDEPRVHRA